ncbi:hypothetical protein DPMN_041576 [Dreissena polymorpha]|uniref:Uncharacterized protein n=1 Tax=Dreissena polymorpha TaxID=45954 RepID=A0A9D4HW76_DREPO|nr:hypothetical protein DPMN_041576 [Dreissena polymorpha]
MEEEFNAACPLTSLCRAELRFTSIVRSYTLLVCDHETYVKAECVVPYHIVRLRLLAWSYASIINFKKSPDSDFHGANDTFRVTEFNTNTNTTTTTTTTATTTNYIINYYYNTNNSNYYYYYF